MAGKDTPRPRTPTKKPVKMTSVTKDQYSATLPAPGQDATPAFKDPGGSTYPSAQSFAPSSTSTPTTQTNPGGFATPSSTTGSVPTESLQGFAGRHFSLADLPTVWQNPWMISDFALDDRGQGNNTKLKELLRQGTYSQGGIAGAGMPIFTMLRGLTDDTSQLGSSDTINYIANLVNSMTQLGGHVPSYEGLLGQLLQARGNDTVLGEALNSGTAQDQINTLMTYLRSALETNTLNPIAGSAVLSQANREGDNFLKASMGGQDGYGRNFTDWINSGGHRLFGS